MVEPTFDQLIAVIQAQTYIVKLDLHLDGVMRIVVERSRIITRATGAVIE